MIDIITSKTNVAIIKPRFFNILIEFTANANAISNTVINMLLRLNIGWMKYSYINVVATTYIIVNAYCMMYFPKRCPTDFQETGALLLNKHTKVSARRYKYPRINEKAIIKRSGYGIGSNI